MKTKIDRRTFGFAASGAVAAMALPARAQGIDFSGTRIEVVITSGEGGGADTYARFMGAQIGQELPGKPTMIYRNMTGGGGVVANNWFEANGTPDGKIVLSMTSSSIMRPVFGNPADYQFNASHWIPVVASPNGYITVGSKVGGTMTIEAILEKAKSGKLAIGVANQLGAGTMVILSWYMLGVPLQVAFNVPGGESELSFQRGEFSLESNNVGDYHRSNALLAERGEIAPLFVFGQRMPDGSLVREPTLPDVPTFPEVYEQVHGKAPDGPEWDAWNAMFDAVCTAAKAFMLAEDTPDDIVQVWRDAAQRALTDPAVMASDRYLNILGTTPQFFGDDARKAMDDAVNQLTPEVVGWMQAWHKENYGVDIR